MSGDWQELAVCGGYGDLFFGPDEEAPEAQDAREARAIAICRPCPARLPCLDWALSLPVQLGVAGGVGEERRKALRHARLNRQWREERAS